MCCIPWTFWEDELVREYYKGNLYLNSVISLTGRTANAIHERSRILGLNDNRVKTKIAWKVGAEPSKNICPYKS